MAETQNVGFDKPWFLGASRRFTVTITDAAGQAKDLTGATVVDWALTDLSPTEGAATKLIEKSLGSGVGITAPTQGQVQIEVDEAETASLAAGDYYHEARVVDAIGDTDSVTFGQVRLTGSAFV